MHAIAACHPFRYIVSNSEPGSLQDPLQSASFDLFGGGLESSEVIDSNLAPQVGFEPTTLRLTAEIHPFYLNLPGFAYIC
jgi:hypothetical protein